MAHTHDVYDMENHFDINGSSRFIKETSETKLVVVQGDHKSEVLTFKMPRYIDGHDMTLCNKIRIHYINLDTKTNNKSADVYEVTDLTLCEECEDVLTFTWTIEAPATKYSGTLSFLVKFECTEGENVLYQWNTAKYVSVNVLAGIDNSEEFVEKYSNVLEEWYNELTKGADSIEELNQQALTEIEHAKEDAKENIENKASEKMKEIDEYCENIEKIIPIFIKWNGDITGRESIELNSTYYKVSDSTYTVEELDGSNLIINGSGETFVVDKSLCSDLGNKNMIHVAAKNDRVIAYNFCVVVKQDMDGVTKGTYFCNADGGHLLSKVTSNNGSWNDLTDKPFYDATTYFEWDGNTEGMSHVLYVGDTHVYKVSDTPLTKDELVGTNVVVKQLGNDEEMVVTVTEDVIVTDENNGYIHNVCDSFLSVVEDTTTSLGLNLPRGLWCFSPETTNGMYIAKLSKGEVKTLDIKFIPEELYTEIDSRIDKYINEALGGEY